VAEAIGIYVHVPFCVRKCRYCDFESQPLGDENGQVDRYLEALSRELALRRSQFESPPAVETVYIGGGTPTVLSAAQLGVLLGRVHDAFPWSESAEVTIEANPGTLDQERAAALRQAGGNRLSLGVQSFTDRMLAMLGRMHSAKEAETASCTARGAGFDNLSLDLIFGVPGQTGDDWIATLQQAVALGPEHISAYQLTLEPGTPLEEMVSRGELVVPPEDVAFDMFYATRRELAAAGYEDYEISNFARQGFRCRHNEMYWRNGEYLGFGPAAHSYRDGVRWRNTGDVEAYAGLLGASVLPVSRAERLSTRARMGESLMLGLRRRAGVAEEEFAQAFGASLRDTFTAEIADLEGADLLEFAAGRLRLTDKGLALGNEVFVRLL
jgi:oxygen-independent coproporphyrinogen-3 oxidase